MGYLKHIPLPKKGSPENLEISTPGRAGLVTFCFGGAFTSGVKGWGGPAVAGGLLLRREPGSDSEESRRSDLADAMPVPENSRGARPVGWWIVFWAQERGKGR